MKKALLLSLTLFIVGTSYPADLPRKQIIIYVHGTLMSGVSLLNTTGLYRNDLEENDWTRKCLTNLRENPKIMNSQVALKMGLENIDQRSINEYAHQTLSSNKSRVGAYQYFGLYSGLQQDNLDYKYYTFGWLGGLDKKGRELAATELHQHIARLSEIYDHNCDFTLICHSHGGNVALNLVQEERINPLGVTVKNLLLFGAPIQFETACFAMDTFFETVYNFYSEYDTIQIADKISMPSHKSFHTFVEALSLTTLKDAPNLIYDVQLSINGDTKYINHEMLGAFHQYKRPDTFLKRLSPFPLSVLTPKFLSLFKPIRDAKGYSSTSLSLVPNQNKISLELSTATGRFINTSLLDTPRIDTAHNYAKKSWTPYSVYQATKIAIAMREVIKFLS
ncbi:MAG TPA: hypothetical protein QGF02_01285 [Candidatus Babeliales bacterium]|nr:hypothetical protein [Candidatus Babeliales bacterium]